MNTGAPPSPRRVSVVALYVACVLAGVSLLAGWVRPWRFADGNPDLHGVATGTASAQLVGGCSPHNSRSLINCVQYVDFDARDAHIRHAPVRIGDGFRRGAEDPSAVLVVYDWKDPFRFRLADGNPTTLGRVLGTAWISLVTLVGGGVAGVLAASGVLVRAEGRHRRGKAGHPPAA
jgi:hypothetical protein